MWNLLGRTRQFRERSAAGFPLAPLSPTGADDVLLSRPDPKIAVIELRRPPNNFFDTSMISGLADLYESLANDGTTRVIVLCAAGKHFCAGADFANVKTAAHDRRALYREALRLYAAPLPVVAAVHGAAVGGGLGLACVADFRVTCLQARFSANFAQLGFHHGFGLSVTLPALVGASHASDLLFTGRRIDGAQAVRIGLADKLVEPGQVRAAALELAAEIGSSGPLAVRAIRRTMRQPLLDVFGRALQDEANEQDRLEFTKDFAEGVAASLGRRDPDFTGQ